MQLTLTDAFGRFGAKPSHRLRGLSAIAADGAMVLNCSQRNFAHPSRGVLRYENRLSTEPDDSTCVSLLGQHLTLALDGALPVRMVVDCQADIVAGASPRSYHVRLDLVGRVVKFDGDHFIVDFVKPEDAAQPVAAGRRK
jgi:hypothetical protein